jgi:hypothetical protein
LLPHRFAPIHLQVFLERAMSFLPLPRVLLVLSLAIGGLALTSTVAQEESTGVVVATGLTNPRGALSVGDLLFVALAGSGGDGAGLTTVGWAARPVR